MPQNNPNDNGDHKSAPIEVRCVCGRPVFFRRPRGVRISNSMMAQFTLLPVPEAERTCPCGRVAVPAIGDVQMLFVMMTPDGKPEEPSRILVPGMIPPADVPPRR